MSVTNTEMKRCQGSAEGVAGVASPQAWCQRWGPGVGAQGAEDSSEPLRCQITVFPSREAETEAQMCVCLHICPQQNLWAFICLCLRPGVHARACVSPASRVSALVFVCLSPGPLSESVAVGLCLSGWQCLVFCV